MCTCFTRLKFLIYMASSTEDTCHVPTKLPYISVTLVITAGSSMWQAHLQVAMLSSQEPKPANGQHHRVVALLALREFRVSAKLSKNTSNAKLCLDVHAVINSGQALAARKPFRVAARSQARRLCPPARVDNQTSLVPGPRREGETQTQADSRLCQGLHGSPS